MAEATGMTDGHHILVLVEVAVGIILGFVVWSFISPMLSTVPSTPTA
jgi:hypothetical protein